MDLLSDEGYRVDGRKPKEFRKITGRLGVFDHADGSAILQQVINYLILIINFDFGAFKLFYQGNTKILAAVFGPREPKGSQKGSADADKCLIDVEYSRAAFSTPERKQRGRGDKRSQEIRQAIIFK